MSSIPNYSMSAPINRVVLRDALADPLYDAGLLQYEKKFVRYEIIGEGATEKVKVHFDDGTFDIGDILLASDGSASKVNRQAGVNNIKALDTHWTFLCEGSLNHELIDSLPQALLKPPVLTASDGMSLYYALYLPVTADAEQTDAKKLDLDETNSSFYWGFTVPRSMVDGSAKDIKDRRQFCLDAVKAWSPEYHTMLAAGADDEYGKDIHVLQARASRQPSRSWRKEVGSENDRTKGHCRVWFSGDAIHAMQPYRGMGGNQALEDGADILPELIGLSQIAKSGRPITNTDIQDSLQRYEATMYKRAFGWVRKSGGDKIPDLDFESLKGKMLLLLARGFFAMAGVYFSVWRFFGWKPKAEAGEFQ